MLSIILSILIGLIAVYIVQVSLVILFIVVCVEELSKLPKKELEELCYLLTFALKPTLIIHILGIL